MSETNYKYYFKGKKIIRDLVHGYVNLTSFDLDIIDTGPFQRLKDIKQLTCWHVYPSAIHTRFEHSLGVYELTKRAIRHINENGIISSKPQSLTINKTLEFNASVAALLHDVGHCQFSHMCEIEFKKSEAQIALCKIIERLPKNIIDENLVKRLGDIKEKNIGSTHELLSCSVLLEHYYTLLSNINIKIPNKNELVNTDFELIIRCILGIEYDVGTFDEYEKNKFKNVVIRLINDKVFDMDKLDYIIRDSFYTGIGTPLIDTQRLFRNMYLNDNGKVIFTNRAIPAIQNMIEARDGLYMYVYNHHAVIYSEFIYSYIFRQLDHNALEDQEETPDIAIGILSREYFFTPPSILEYQYSDSDLLSNLNVQYYHAIQYFDKKNEPQCLDEKVIKALQLIKDLRERKFLKPWWKTVFEMSSFMQRHFPDDKIRKKVGQYICREGKFGLDTSEFRSQIAKHVIEITKKIFKRNKKNFIIEPLVDGDFFVVQRSNRFFEPDIIEKIEICLSKNEIIGPPTDVKYMTGEFYVKSLTNIIPQKNYSSIYAKDGFYIYTKQIAVNEFNRKEISNHYKILERIFAFVATELVRMGEQNFVKHFQLPDFEILDVEDLSNEEWTEFKIQREKEKKQIKKNEEASIKKIIKKFVEFEQ